MYAKIIDPSPVRSLESFYGTLPGSFQDIEDKVRMAVQAKYEILGEGMASQDKQWCTVIGTYPDRVIFKTEKGKALKYWSAGWSSAQDGSVLLQPAAEISLAVVATPVAGDGKGLALEQGKRNSNSDEQALLDIVRHAVYLLGPDKVMEACKTKKPKKDVM